MKRNNRQTSTRVLWTLILSISALIVLTQVALGEKEAKTYPEQGKIVGMGTSGHTDIPSHPVAAW